MGELSGRMNRRLPSPSGEQTIAFAAEWTQPAVAHSERDPQMASTAGAAIPQHFCVRRADDPFRQPPFRPYVGVAPCCKIGIETGKASRNYSPCPLEEPVLRAFGVSGFQRQAFETRGIDPTAPRPKPEQTAIGTYIIDFPQIRGAALLPYQMRRHLWHLQTIARGDPDHPRREQFTPERARRDGKPDHRCHAEAWGCGVWRERRRLLCVIDTSGSTRSSPKLLASSLSRPE